MYTPRTSRHFIKHTDPSGAAYYTLRTHAAHQQQGFYFVNASMSEDGRYLWFYATFPPAKYQTLGVVDFETDEVRHFPETHFLDATPIVSQDGVCYYADDRAVYKKSPLAEADAEKVCDLPALLFENGAVVRSPACHLTFSPDKKALFLDSITTKGCIAGALTLETGAFREWCRPEFYRNHGQYNPVYEGLALMAEDFDIANGFYIRTDENGVFQRLWTVQENGEQRVWPPLNRMRATHEWWSADGRKIYYCRYVPDNRTGVCNNGVCSIDIFTGEHTLAAPVPAWHAFTNRDESLIVYDENEIFYRGCPSRVGLYNVKTGKKAYIVSDNPAMASRENPSAYHLDPHPRFNANEKYIDAIYRCGTGADSDQGVHIRSAVKQGPEACLEILAVDDQYREQQKKLRESEGHPIFHAQQPSGKRPVHRLHRLRGSQAAAGRCLYRGYRTPYAVGFLSLLFSSAAGFFRCGRIFSEGFEPMRPFSIAYVAKTCYTWL